MARISKKVLLEGARQALSGSGRQIKVLSKDREHPLRVAVVDGQRTLFLRIYIWSLTHGGGLARPGHEYRIQVTSGVSRFEQESGEKTLILGWSSEFGVYACFDVKRHTRPLGSSPSMQIGKSALLRASQAGLAAHTRKNAEIALAVRPDLLLSYCERLDALHDEGTAEAEIDKLEVMRAYPENVADVSLDVVARVEATLAGGGRPRFGDANERKQRRTILDRLEALERHAGLGDATPPQIGHNKPPEPIDSDLATNLPGLIKEATLPISEELKKNRPNAEKISKKTAVLARVTGGLKSAAAKTTKNLYDETSKWAAGAILAGGAAGVGHLTGALGPVLDSISTWLRMIF
jgi:hypothetical protein